MGSALVVLPGLADDVFRVLQKGALFQTGFAAGKEDPVNAREDRIEVLLVAVVVDGKDARALHLDELDVGRGDVRVFLSRVGVSRRRLEKDSDHDWIVVLPRAPAEREAESEYKDREPHARGGGQS